jgi:type 1 fimbriae regulatory protein FimB/type 1 fimbriae regulatory protein FimE
MELLLKAARSRGRYGQRDYTLLFLAYRHGFRVSELVRLQWGQVHLDDGHLDVRRRKGGRDSAHRLHGEEIRALRQLRRDWPSAVYVFLSERGAPLTTAGVRKIVSKAGEAAGFAFPLHPHMLRHATGYKLVNDREDTRAIQDYLGHQNIRHTERYTQLDPHRLDQVWPE